MIYNPYILKLRREYLLKIVAIVAVVRRVQIYRKEKKSLTLTHIQFGVVAFLTLAERSVMSEKKMGFLEKRIHMTVVREI